MVKKIVEEIKRRFKKEGNGFIISHKNGNKYSIYAQEDGHFLITDKVTIWNKETYCKIFNTIEDLAKELINL